MISEDEAYNEVKLTQGLRLTLTILSEKCGGSNESFGGLRIGEPIWKQLDLYSIDESVIFDEKTSLEDIEPFTGRFTLTWFFVNSTPYVSLRRLGRYSEQVDELEDYSTTHELAPNILYSPIDGSVITKELDVGDGWDFAGSEYTYKMHQNGARREVSLESIYCIPDKTLLDLLPTKYSSEIISIII